MFISMPVVRVRVLFSALFFSLSVSGLGLKYVYICILWYARTSFKYAYAYRLPMYAGLCMRTHTHA